MKTISLFRKGDFRMNDSGENKCASSAQMLFRYEVTIVGPFVLNEMGFFIDQLDVNNRVRVALKMFNGSCEQAAEQIRRAVVALCHLHNVTLNSIDVRVFVDAGSAYVLLRETFDR